MRSVHLFPVFSSAQEAGTDGLFKGHTASGYCPSGTRRRPSDIPSQVGKPPGVVSLRSWKRKSTFEGFWRGYSPATFWWPLFHLDFFWRATRNWTHDLADVSTASYHESYQVPLNKYYHRNWLCSKIWGGISFRDNVDAQEGVWIVAKYVA